MKNEPPVTDGKDLLNNSQVPMYLIDIDTGTELVTGYNASHTHDYVVYDNPANNYTNNDLYYYEVQ